MLEGGPGSWKPANKSALHCCWVAQNGGSSERAVQQTGLFNGHLFPHVPQLSGVMTSTQPEIIPVQLQSPKFVGHTAWALLEQR